MSIGSNVTVEVDMGKKCVECGKGGATQNGCCLRCFTKAMGDKPMNSELGRLLRRRFEHLRNNNPR
jgi:hypothetical protein